MAAILVTVVFVFEMFFIAINKLTIQAFTIVRQPFSLTLQTFKIAMLQLKSFIFPP